jgi:hypothetical protein
LLIVSGGCSLTHLYLPEDNVIIVGKARGV